MKNVARPGKQGDALRKAKVHKLQIGQKGMVVNMLRRKIEQA